MHYGSTSIWSRLLRGTPVDSRGLDWARQGWAAMEFMRQEYFINKPIQREREILKGSNIFIENGISPPEGQLVCP